MTKWIAWLVAAAFLVACDAPAADTVADAGSGSDTGSVSDSDTAPAPAVVYAPHTVLDIPIEADEDGVLDIADPHVLKVGDDWYLYATSSKRDLAVWRSRDLAAWEALGTAWEPTPGSWNEQGQVWAPHVEATDEGYYLYYTAALRIGVAHSESPAGPFVEVYDHPLVGAGYGGVGDGVGADDPLSFDENSIDAFVLRSADGGLYFYATAYTPLSTLRGIPMQDYTTLDPGPWTTLLEPQVNTWEGLIVEAPWLFEHAGRVYLLYAGNGAETANYATGLAVADSPLGPFERLSTQPFLARDEDAGRWGPGHVALAPGAHDDRLLFYHTKISPETGFERRLRYGPVAPDADAGLRWLVAP